MPYNVWDLVLFTESWPEAFCRVGRILSIENNQYFGVGINLITLRSFKFAYEENDFRRLVSEEEHLFLLRVAKSWHFPPKALAILETEMPPEEVINEWLHKQD